MLTSHPARNLITRILPHKPSKRLFLLPRRPPYFLSLIPPFLQHLPLSSSAPLRKKKDKSPPHTTTTTTASEKGAKGPTASSKKVPAVVVDPLDFSAFEAAIERILESLKVELAKLRHTGRSPEVIEALRVKLVKGSKDTVTLGEIAQVFPRGRVLLVAVGEKDVCPSDPSRFPPPPAR